MYIKEEKCLKLFSKIVKHLGLKLSWQPGLICAMGFITRICWIVLGPLGGGAVDPKKYWNFEKLKIAILASG